MLRSKLLKSRQSPILLETQRSYGTTSKLRKSLSGFTIIELLIATAVFAVILLLATYALLQIGRTYYKGITESKTQDTARSVMDTIATAIQFSGAPVNVWAGPPTPGGTYDFCIGSTRYSYILDRQLTDSVPIPGQQSQHVLTVDSPTSCSPGATVPPARDFSLGCLPTSNPLTNCQELLRPNMRLSQFVVQQVGTTNIYHITVGVVYGDQVLLTPAHDRCAATINVGGQFCALSVLSTDVQRRL